MPSLPGSCALFTELVLHQNEAFISPLGKRQDQQGPGVAAASLLSESFYQARRSWSVWGIWAQGGPSPG